MGGGGVTGLIMLWPWRQKGPHQSFSLWREGISHIPTLQLTLSATHSNIETDGGETQYPSCPAWTSSSTSCSAVIRIVSLIGFAGCKQARKLSFQFLQDRISLEVNTTNNSTDTWVHLSFDHVHEGPCQCLCGHLHTALKYMTTWAGHVDHTHQLPDYTDTQCSMKRSGSW